MNIVRKLFMDDINKYVYMMSKQQVQSYQIRKLMGMGLCFVLGLILIVFKGFSIVKLAMVLGFACIGYKAPYVVLQLKFNQQRNLIIDAIPLWVNMIYSLIGENNIYNAIVISYADAPTCIRQDLDAFIDKIHTNNSDKDAYIDFLSRYKIERFKDIMMKLYEFRNLSKDKLKYEISRLNESLGSIEHIKRERRYKSELFVADSLTLVMMSIPCIYMFFVSLILSELMLK